MSYLLQYGADAKLKNEDNETALDVALFKGRYRGTSLIRNSTPPWDHNSCLGIVLL